MPESLLLDAVKMQNPLGKGGIVPVSTLSCKVLPKSQCKLRCMQLVPRRAVLAYQIRSWVSLPTLSGMDPDSPLMLRDLLGNERRRPL